MCGPAAGVHSRRLKQHCKNARSPMEARTTGRRRSDLLADRSLHAAWHVAAEQVTQVFRSQTMQEHVCEQKYFVLDAAFDGEPVTCSHLPIPSAILAQAFCTR